MKFIKPKNNKAENVDWLISERVRAIVKTYAEYTEYSESEVVDMLLLNILDDKDFIKWIENRRNNRRIVKQLEIEDLVETDKIV
ncbi:MULTISPECIES: hypothetical protein [Bacillaceae]|uniref:Uncharacterized protein n=2 Tax=Bacillaceae TaxID=186817 RepID=A0A7Y0PKW7_9BACI|nr:MULTISPECIES: hypothetical protein [Bacillaceae]NMO76412.1 hypothetical protein [Niallia alba]UTI44128.1 hypothetical protein NKG37_11100 [Niallia sp. RD1]WNF21324.1 hypothetical protein RH061_14080 [Mesobacillus jeotgali]